MNPNIGMKRRTVLLAAVTTMILWQFSFAIFFEELILSSNMLLRSPEGFALILISNDVLFYATLSLWNIFFSHNWDHAVETLKKGD